MDLGRYDDRVGRCDKGVFVNRLTDVPQGNLRSERLAVVDDRLCLAIVDVNFTYPSAQKNR